MEIIMLQLHMMYHSGSIGLNDGGRTGQLGN